MVAILKFTVKDCDPANGEPDSDEGYDQLDLEDLGILVSSQVPWILHGSNKGIKTKNIFVKERFKKKSGIFQIWSATTHPPL